MSRLDGPSDIGRVLLGGMRWIQANIGRGGEDIGNWLKENQKKGTSQAYGEADKHADDWYGPLLRANAADIFKSLIDPSANLEVSL